MKKCYAFTGGNNSEKGSCQDAGTTREELPEPTRKGITDYRIPGTKRRFDVKKILQNPKLKKELFDGVVQFMRFVK